MKNGFELINKNNLSLNLTKDYKDLDCSSWPIKKTKDFMRVKAINKPTKNLIAIDKFCKGVAGPYLGAKPMLYSCSISWSFFTQNQEPRASQMWHRDWEANKSVKFFILLKDAFYQNGPFCFLDSIKSNDISKKINYTNDRAHKIEDTVINNYIAESDKNYLVGSAGNMVAIDTCTCFHFGSRVESGDRLIMTLQYFSEKDYRGVGSVISW